MFTFGLYVDFLMVRVFGRVFGIFGFYRGRRVLFGGKFFKYMKGIWMGLNVYYSIFWYYFFVEVCMMVVV